MDTAVLKSWFEVVRRTDPLIWALAMDSPSSSQTENSIDSLILASSSPCPASSPSLFASASAPTALIGSGSDTAAMDIMAAKTRMFSSLRNSHCKSLAVSQPQNATDCLKCLVQTTTSHDDLHLKQDSHQHRLPQTMRRSIERGAAKAPAGSLVVTMAMENVHKDEEGMISRRTMGASSEQENTPAGSTSNTGTASGSTGSGPGSPSSSSSSSKASGSSTNTHQRKTTNSNHSSHSDNTYYATTFNWMYYATEPVATSAAASPSTRFGSIIEDHAGTSSSTTSSSSGNAVGGGAIIPTSTATAATAAVASHIAREREALAAASAAAPALSSGELQGAESTNNSDTLTSTNTNTNTNALANTNNSIDSTITNNAIASATTTATTTITTATTTTTTTTTTAPSTDNNKDTQSLPARFTTLFPQASTITVVSATQFLHSIFLSSTEATTAFLYRTFSPTYRICTLYKTSFTDGSQLRGLTRMKDSVMRADAVVLVKSSARQMKDVWGMVMDAYGVKAKMTKEKKRQEEREKAVREKKEIVEERIRSKTIGEAIVAATETAPTTTEVEVEVERRKSVGDDGDGGSSSEGGNEGTGEE